MSKLPQVIQDYQKKYKREYSRILRAIKRYDRIVVFRHIMPDYDALGSQMGLATFLKDNFPEKEIHVVGDNHVTFTPRLYPVMDSLNEEWFKKPFMAIILDVGNKSRIADPRFMKAKYRVKIDHHPTEENFCNVNILDADSAAAAEIVADMLLSFKGYKISPEAASYLYSAIVGDSGRFMYSSTSEHTFAIAEQLIATGFNFSKLYQRMYVKQLDDLKVTAYILNNFYVSPHGVAYYILESTVQKELKITTERGKENVNIFSNIDGINAWCSITEDPKDQCWRVSLRSKEKPIDGVAAMFEGGGHAQASGCKLNNLDELPKLIQALDDLFKE